MPTDPKLKLVRSLASLNIASCRNKIEILDQVLSKESEQYEYHRNNHYGSPRDLGRSCRGQEKPIHPFEYG